MFTRVVNLLTFKGLLSRVRRGKGKRRDQPRPQNPKPHQTIRTYRNLCGAYAEPMRSYPQLLRSRNFFQVTNLAGRWLVQHRLSHQLSGIITKYHQLSLKTKWSRGFFVCFVCFVVLPSTTREPFLTDFPSAIPANQALTSNLYRARFAPSGWPQPQDQQTIPLNRQNPNVCLTLLTFFLTEINVQDPMKSMVLTH